MSEMGDRARRKDARSAPTGDWTVNADCASINLPANGVLTLADGTLLTLPDDAVFEPLCARAVDAGPVITGNAGLTLDQTSTGSNSNLQFSDFRDPFYASTFPQCYALAATTIISYMLVVMLLIAPRSFLDGGVVVLGRHGFTNGPSNGISIGGRPWLQKVAALTVAVSLTIATVDTFRVAEDQYAWGIQNAQELQEEVLDGTELKVIRLISDTFLWLAQAQTLIRLFPRQREKVIIKWTAFSLITLDVIFGALNSFQYTGPGNSRPRSFTDAVPALAYLFQLSLGLLYAAWVIYYSLMKKRYAFYHPLMKNIGLVAALSIMAIIVPVVFFILDVSKPDLAGWGDYVRWVGAAAASVIVWEWVERIEALEREVKKDGILGREVFDGDEMMEESPDYAWPRRRKGKRKGDDDGGESGRGGSGSVERGSCTGRGNMWPAMSSIASRYMARSEPSAMDGQHEPSDSGHAQSKPASRFLKPPLWPARPPPAVTPVSRTETASADSTEYAVQYQPLTETTSRTHNGDRPVAQLSRSSSVTSSGSQHPPEQRQRPATPPSPAKTESEGAPKAQSARNHIGWFGLANIVQLRSGGKTPPAEVIPHTQKKRLPAREYEGLGWWDVRGRIEDFAATQADKMREKLRPTPDTDSLPVTVIPAPARPGAALAQLQEEGQAEPASAGTQPEQQQQQSRSATPTRRLARSASDASGTSDAIAARVNTSPEPTPRSHSSPAERGDVLQLRLPREPPPPMQPQPQRAAAAARRPVDDILRAADGDDAR